jgi:hypothetical protein
MEAAIGGFLLGSGIETGKRGRYKIYMCVLDGWDAERNDLIKEDNSIPEKPWLAVTTAVIESKGDYQYKEDCSISLLITHHALSRLTQRCGARNLREVYAAVRRIAIVYVQRATERAVRNGERMSIELPYDMGTAICALTHHADGEGGVVLATLWKLGEAEESKCENEK